MTLLAEIGCVVPDSDALQLVPHALTVEEEAVLLECGLGDVEE